MATCTARRASAVSAASVAWAGGLVSGFIALSCRCSHELWLPGVPAGGGAVAARPFPAGIDRSRGGRLAPDAEPRGPGGKCYRALRDLLAEPRGVRPAPHRRSGLLACLIRSRYGY